MQYKQELGTFFPPLQVLGTMALVQDPKMPA